MIIFNTGTNFYLSKLELEKLFPEVEISKVRRDFLLVDIDLSKEKILELQEKIGGTKKIFSVLKEGLYEDDVLEKIFEELKIFREKKEGKMRVGINFFSSLGKKTEGDGVKKIIKECKGEISGIRFVNKNFSNLEDVLSKKQVVDKGGLEITAVEDENTGKYFLIKTESVQDVDFYAKRDYEKPQRSARVGMLPPKLAQMLINFAGNGNENVGDKAVWDPFCGTGTVLLEAGLMGFKKIFGSDASEEMIDFSEKNFEYLESGKIFEEKKNIEREKFFEEREKNFDGEKKIFEPKKIFLEGRKNFSGEKEIFLQDVRRLKNFGDEKIDFVVTEGYLGKNMFSFASERDIAENDEVLSVIWEDALYNFAKNGIKKIVFCLPCYPQEGGNKIFLQKTLAILKNSQYNSLAGQNIYGRKGQFVHRDIHILELK